MTDFEKLVEQQVKRDRENYRTGCFHGVFMGVLLTFVVYLVVFNLHIAGNLY